MTVLNNKQLAILMCRSLKKYAEPTSAYIDLDSDKINQDNIQSLQIGRETLEVLVLITLISLILCQVNKAHRGN